MRWRGSLALFALGCAIALGARAEDPPQVEEVGPDAELFDDRHSPEAQVWIERPVVLEAQLGLGAPLGLGGAALDVATGPGFSLNAGLGVGESTRSLQLGLQARMRLIVASGLASFAEGGLSMGRYEEQSDCQGPRCPPVWRWDRAVWGNVGLGLELRKRSGLALRWSFGGEGIFNVTSARCRSCGPTDEPNMWHTAMPYTLVACGWAFRP